MKIILTTQNSEGFSNILGLCGPRCGNRCLIHPCLCVPVAVTLLPCHSLSGWSPKAPARYVKSFIIWPLPISPDPALDVPILTSASARLMSLPASALSHFADCPSCFSHDLGCLVSLLILLNSALSSVLPKTFPENQAPPLVSFFYNCCLHMSPSLDYKLLGSLL